VPAPVLLELIAGRGNELRQFNLLAINLSEPVAVESLAVGEAPDCPACGKAPKQIGTE